MKGFNTSDGYMGLVGGKYIVSDELHTVPTYGKYMR